MENISEIYISICAEFNLDEKNQQDKLVEQKLHANSSILASSTHVISPRIITTKHFAQLCMKERDRQHLAYYTMHIFFFRRKRYSL